jgi:hypothetical protein
MKIFFYCSILFLALASVASAKEKEHPSAIEHVTVFLNGAQVQRAATLNLEKGVHQLRLTDLPPTLDPSSVQVKGFGEFTILSVKHQFDMLDMSDEEKALEDQQLMWQDSVSWYESILKVYEEEESLLQSNKKLGSEQNGANIAQLQQAADFYRKRLMEIQQKKFALKHKIEKAKERIEQIDRKINELWDKEEEQISEILVTLSAEQNSRAKLQITYYVPDAGWTPAYDARVQNTDQPVTLNYKAKVYQNTSEDWENVKLSLSTGNPQLSARLPRPTGVYYDVRPGRSESNKDYIYKKFNPNIRKVRGKVTAEADGLGLPGISVTVKGYKDIGVLTDIEGEYELEIPQGARNLVYSFVGMKAVEIPIHSAVMNVGMKDDVQLLSEVVVTGSALQGKAAGVNISSASKSLTIETQEQATTSRFDIKLPYTIPSKGEEQTVEIKKLQLKAAYEYYAAPAENPAAFLTANISGWEESHLLNGETNLYLDGTFVGTSSLNFRSKSDTITLSLGQDQNISVQRQKVKFERGTSFSNQKEKSEWKVTVRNHKGSTITLKLQEQVPVSRHKSIEVDFDIPQNATYDEATGILTWMLQLGPHETSEVSYSYEVSYPKDERIYLQ